jgi:HD superfamily phosphohydrolase
MPPSRIHSPCKIFRDPVHRLIRIAPDDEFILDLIDTPPMQRMRRIRQLGVSWLTYHGAEHSRFVHSLGVFNFAQRIIESLQTRYGKRSDVYKKLDKHARTIKAAALLHDIGHAPFSHMLERAFGKSHHEERTIELIKQDNGPIAAVLGKHGLDPEDVASIIRKDFPDKLAVDIVSSQLDADRMDYLLRDSYCTGVGYGEFDADWMIHAMCVGQLNGTEVRTKDKQYKLCLDQRRGVYAAERFVMARLHMYQQVYMHRVTRGFEVVALNLFKAAAHRAAYGGLPKGTPQIVQTYFKNQGKLDPDVFVRFDESQVVAAFHCWAESTATKDNTIIRLAKAFLHRERPYTSCLIDGGQEATAKLGAALEKLPLEPDRHTPRFKIDSFEDTPYKGVFYQAQTSAGGSGDNKSILLSDPDQPTATGVVESRSAMLKHLDAEKFVATRLYYDRALENDVQNALKESGITPAKG